MLQFFKARLGFRTPKTRWTTFRLCHYLTLALFYLVCSSRFHLKICQNRLARIRSPLNCNRINTGMLLATIELHFFSITYTEGYELTRFDPGNHKAMDHHLFRILLQTVLFQDCTTLDLECGCPNNTSLCKCALGGKCLPDGTCHAAECAGLGLTECACYSKGPVRLRYIVENLFGEKY